MDIDFKLIGSRIQTKRKHLRKTQEDLAEYLNVSVGYVSTLERGKTKISLSTLARISDFLGCDISELISHTSTNGAEYMDSELSSTVNRLDAKEKQTLLTLLNAYLSDRS